MRRCGSQPKATIFLSFTSENNIARINHNNYCIGGQVYADGKYVSGQDNPVKAG